MLCFQRVLFDCRDGTVTGELQGEEARVDTMR